MSVGRDDVAVVLATLNEGEGYWKSYRRVEAGGL